MAQGRNITIAAILALAAPSLISQFISAPFIGVVPGLYAKYMGVSLGAISAIVLISRIFDAVTDPVIGLLSDRYKRKWNTRKPWLVLGFLVTALASWFVSTPAENSGIIYFAAWSLVFYLGWTMIEVPHNAWSAEITENYNRRTTVFFVKTMFAAVGALAFALVPLLPMFESTEFTFETMRVTALIFLGLGLVCVLCAVALAPSGAAGSADKPVMRIGQKYLISMFENGPFARFIIAFLISGLAAGMNGTLQFLYLDAYLGLGEHVAIALGSGVFLGIFGIIAWYLIMLRMQKHRAWAISLALGAGWILAPSVLVPGEQALIPYMVMFAGMVLSVGAGLIAPYTLLGDIVDHDRWRTGEDRAGMYFAVFLFAVKLNTALGGALAFLLLDLSGFDATAESQTMLAGAGIRLAFAILPGLLFLTACAIMWTYPLTRDRHAEILAELKARLEEGAGDTPEEEEAPAHA
ncbi:MAG: MFS transporter [Hyphomonadaceae bacterium]|nr:MFS transporter [Hyphomonadaceae bacterium]